MPVQRWSLHASLAATTGRRLQPHLRRRRRRHRQQLQLPHSMRSCPAPFVCTSVKHHLQVSIIRHRHPPTCRVISLALILPAMCAELLFLSSRGWHQQPPQCPSVFIQTAVLVAVRAACSCSYGVLVRTHSSNPFSSSARFTYSSAWIVGQHQRKRCRQRGQGDKR